MTKFKFKEDAERVYSDDYFYDLFEGWYICPKEVLVEESQAKEVEKAMKTVSSFLSQMESAGLLKER